MQQTNLYQNNVTGKETSLKQEWMEGKRGNQEAQALCLKDDTDSFPRQMLPRSSLALHPLILNTDVKLANYSNQGKKLG